MKSIAQTLAASAAAAVLLLATAANAQTVYTEDIIQGKQVISQLDVKDLEPGKKHHFFFQGVQMGTGQHWYLPVVVAKGARPGKRILLISGVHGDELSPVDAVQRVMAQLDPAKMSGTVLAVYDVSRPAMEGTTRKWPAAQQGGTVIDLNRVWPGNEEGNSAPARHAGLVFNRLLKPNADYALDNHTAGTGGDFTAFIFAKMDKAEIRAMAELFPIEQIKNDPGYEGTLETALVKAGIPTLTTELGGPRSFDRRIVPMFVEGTLNVLKHHGVIEGSIGRTAAVAGTFIGNAFSPVRATHGGFLELKVDLPDTVVPGQQVAIQRNSFGEIVAEYHSDVTGQVSWLHRDAMIEPGRLVMEILYYNPDPACEPEGCPSEAGDYIE